MLGDGGILSGGFAWVYPANALKSGPLAPLFGTTFPLMPDLLRIYSSYGTGDPVTIDGIGSMSRVRLDKKTIGAIKVERDIYRFDERAAAIVIMPGRSAKITVNVKVNGDQRSTEQVSLNKRGVGLMFINQLELGDYTLEIDGAEHITSSFTVAEFSVPKLSASLKGMPVISDENDTVAVVAQILSYGEPYTARVRVRLSEGGTPIGNFTNITPDANGMINAELDLNMARKQLALQIESIGEADLTCQVALRGSAKTDREQLQINNLGQIRTISMMPRDLDDEPVRGLFFTEGLHSNSPLSVLNNCGDTLFVESRVEMPLLTAVVYDPIRDTYTEQRYTDLMPGADFHMDMESPFVLILFAAWMREGNSYVPYLAWTTFVKDSSMQLRLDHERDVRPNDELPVVLRTSEPATVAIFAYPAQLTASNSGTSALARAMMREMQRWGENMPSSTPTTTIYSTYGGGWRGRNIHQLDVEAFFEAAPRQYVTLSPQLGTTLRGSPQALGIPSTPMIPKSDPQSLGVFHVLSADGATVQTQTRTVEMVALRERGPLTICAMLVQVDGTEEIRIPTPSDIGPYAITAFAIGDGLNWASTESSVLIDTPVYIDMRDMQFLMQGDMATVRARVQTRSGQAHVVAYQNDVPLQITIKGQPVHSGQIITTPATVEVVIRGPGRVIMQVECAESGEVGSHMIEVQEPRAQTSRFPRSTVVMPGAKLRLADLPDAVSMRVLPGLEGEARRLITAVGDFHGKCCEQTSASLLSLLANICQGDESSVAKWEAGYNRMMQMIVGNGAIRFYPGRGENSHYSPLAARNLARMVSFQTNFALADKPTIRRQVNQLAQAGRMACGHYLILFGEGMRDAIEAWDFTHSALAAEYVRNRVIWDGSNYVLSGPNNYAGGTVGVRAEAAYAAACLARAGDIRAAIGLANWVNAQFGENGSHSTYDGLGVTFMMSELLKGGIGVGTRELIVDDQVMTLEQAIAEGTVGSVQATAGAVMVQYQVEVTRHWADYEASIPVEVGLLDRRGQVATQVRAGEDATLIVKLPGGYQPGLMATICLPPSLAVLEGGAQVVQTTVDFAGNDEIRFAIKVLAQTERSQHVAVLVTSMYDDSKAGNPQPFAVTVL